MTKEYTDYTPLMLCAAGGEENFEGFKILLKHKASYTTKDSNDNNVLQVAAAHDNNKVMEYIVKNLEVDTFWRNNAGETALTICQNNNNEAGVELL